MTASAIDPTADHVQMDGVGRVFYMTFLGPLSFVDDAGNTIALVGREQVLEASRALSGNG